MFACTEQQIELLYFPLRYYLLIEVMLLLLSWKRGREAWDFLLRTLKQFRRHIAKEEKINLWHAL